MEIRDLQTADTKAVIEIFLSVQQIHVKNRPDVFQNITQIEISTFKQFLSDINIVATINSVVVGFAFASIKEIKENLLLKSDTIFYIESMGVKEEYRKKGIGKKMFAVLETIAKQKNIETIQLNVWTFNQEAIKLYENLNYKNSYNQMEKKV